MAPLLCELGNASHSLSARICIRILIYFTSLLISKRRLYSVDWYWSSSSLTFSCTSSSELRSITFCVLQWLLNEQYSVQRYTLKLYPHRNACFIFVFEFRTIIILYSYTNIVWKPQIADGEQFNIFKILCFCTYTNSNLIWIFTSTAKSMICSRIHKSNLMHISRPVF
jgi:hypothetical protein